jgi:hypothetical protein
MTFDAVAGEKERGTLRLVLSHPIRRVTFLVGKGLGAIAAIVVPFALVSWLAFGLSSAFYPALLASGTIWRFFLIVFSSTIYLTLFIALGLLGSSLVMRSHSASVLLLGVWILAVLVAPRFGGLIAERVVPVESDAILALKRQEIQRTVRHAQTEAVQKAFVQAGFLVFEADGVRSRSDPQKKAIRSGIAVTYGAQLGERIQRLEEEHLRRQRNRDRLANLLTLLSPASTLEGLLGELAGTGDLMKTRVADGERAFYTSSQTVYFSRIFDEEFVDPAGNGSVSEQGPIGAALPDLAALPHLTIQEPTRGELARAVLPKVGQLVVLVLALFGGALTIFKDYDAR